MVIFCVPPLTHATDAVRLCICDKCNHYCMSCHLQMRTESLAHPSICKAACQVHSQPVPCTILQFTPTWWVNMGFSPIVGTGESLGWHLHRFGSPSSTLRCLKFLSSVYFGTSQGSIIPQPSMNPISGGIICAITKPPTTFKMSPPPQQVRTVAHHCCLLSTLVSSITGLQACIFWIVQLSPYFPKYFTWVSGLEKQQCYPKLFFSSKSKWGAYF